MAVRDNVSAIGLESGKVDTNGAGNATYSLKLTVPPGIRAGTEPEISLEYSQGAPNGSVGVGWALGGLSTIRRASTSRPWDDFNPSPKDYDALKPKLVLDGVELLNISGTYDAEDAQYSTEIEGSRRIVTRTGTSGFVVSDSTTGHRDEYGTSDDSVVKFSDNSGIREWRLKRSVDYHGNAITYHYLSSIHSGDVNACYISRIQYTSNENTGYTGMRVVDFEYSERPDKVVQTVQGEKCTWASLLTAVRFGTIDANQSAARIHNSYELEHHISQFTAESCLVQVTQVGSTPSETLKLLPSKFQYTVPGVTGDARFEQFQPINLDSSQQAAALFTMNISGRALADLGYVQYDKSSDSLTLKAYPANRNPQDQTYDWKMQSGTVAEVQLPKMDRRDGFPSILSPDWTSDGRADLIIPFRDYDSLSFSLSRCIGIGFEPPTIKKTSYDWIEKSKFLTVDFTGRGNFEILQIFGDPQRSKKVTFRTFASSGSKDDLALGDAIESLTDYDNEGTVDWCQVSNTRTGARCVVRIWAEDVGGLSQLKATTFVSADPSTPGTKLVELKTADLGEATPRSSSKLSVLPCDINADGAQDIVLARADYSGSVMTLSFTTYLDNGAGGFAIHGKEIQKDIQAPEPNKAVDAGEFHVTNLNGSNYPTLSYVYQARMSNDVVCLSVDGRSDGSVGEADSYVLAKGLPTSSVKVMATDINGNGMGDWIFYDLADGNPYMVPVYNRCNATNLLAQVLSPMGLQTSISYGNLSDPAVYTTAVDWTAYSNTEKESFPLLGSPNVVVTQLEHQNDSALNCLDYHVQIQKTYHDARISTVGRGWQGFESIDSRISSQRVLMTEKYHQVWPLSGSKYQVDTKTLDGQVLQTENILRDVVVNSPLGSWKIYRIDKKQERVDMIENSRVVRSNGTDYMFDGHGNMILRSPWELQGAKETSRTYERSSYTTMDKLTGVMTAFKVSTNVSNTDMAKYQPGDCTLTLYKSELQTYSNASTGIKTTKNVLSEVSEWSTDIADFVRSTLKFNQYGKIIQTVNAAGLTENTTYDSIFQTFAVKTTFEGPGSKLIELAAYDTATGMEVARKSRDGRLVCHQVDVFGRTYDTRVATSAPREAGMLLGKDFLAQRAFVSDAALPEALNQTYLCPHQTMAFEQEKSPRGAAYMLTNLNVLANPDVNGKYQQCEYLDCTGKTRKRSSCDGDEKLKTWQTFDFDTRGARVFESFPSSGNGVDIDWLPDRSFGTITEFDILGRPIKTIRPAHGDVKGFLIDTNTYTNGGAAIEENKYAVPTATEPVGPGMTPLLQTTRRFIRYDGQRELLVKSTQDNRTTEFVYNGMGQLITCRDADGHEEHHVRNAQGQIVELKTRQQTVKSSYDSALHLVKEEFIGTSTVITYHRDCFGRPLQQLGSDGRTVQFIYDKGGVENVASITVLPRGPDQAFESRLEFDYDGRGRVASRKLTLDDGASYATKFAYDWQDRVIEKVQPDGVVARFEFVGTRASTSSLSGGTTSTWNLKAEHSAFDAFGRPTQTAVQGTGVKDSFLHEWSYDSQGFPLQHRLGTGNSTLIQEHYVYNGLDQMSRKHEMISGTTIDYTYAGLRLASSQAANGPINSYSYDNIGNLLHKAGTDIRYDAANSRAFGTRNGRSVFDITYDTAGRVTQRNTEHGDFSFNYDSFGALQSLREGQGGAFVEMWSDHSGVMYRRQDSKGAKDLFVSGDFSIHTRADGSRVSVHKLLDTANPQNGSAKHLGSVSLEYENAASTKPLSGGRSIKVHFADTKGTITRTFKGEDGSMLEQIEYDDFGLLSDPSSSTVEGHATYEGNFFDNVTGLLHFCARFYDPLIGRFTTPDSITELEYLTKTDGLNRYAFENNDPINHMDPTGHWSWRSVLGVCIGVALVVAAVAITVATAGAGSPLLVAAVVGATMSAGVAGIQYSVKHKDETDDKKFWGGFGTTLAINAAVGALTGVATAGVGSAFAGAATKAVIGRVAGNAIIGGVNSVVTKMGDKGVENVFYGQHHNLLDGIASDFATGALTGGLASYGADKASKYGPGALSKVRSYTPWKGAPGPVTGSFKLVANAKNAIDVGSLGAAMGQEAALSALKPSVTLGFWQLNDHVLTPYVTPFASKKAGEALSAGKNALSAGNSSRMMMTHIR